MLAEAEISTTLSAQADFETILGKWRDEIDRRLVKLNKGRQPDSLYEPVRYVLDGRGKRIRPVLLLLACQAVEGSVDECWDAALAVELLHNFTLVHDDIMDQDDTRRGRATVHNKWNSHTAILAGDALVALSFATLMRSANGDISEIGRIFTHGIVEVCEGQALDLEFETRDDVEIGEYFAMIGKKTARLLDVCARIGGILGNGSPEQVNALGEFAFNLGCAFQVQDDLLDITSDEITIGKSFASDVKKKKQTYLLIHALTHADTNTKKTLLDLLSRPVLTPLQIEKIKGIFDSTGSLDAAETTVRRYLTTAERNLTNLPSTQGTELLHTFLRYISNRNA